jgi:hypothetical protein
MAETRAQFKELEDLNKKKQKEIEEMRRQIVNLEN